MNGHSGRERGVLPVNKFFKFNMDYFGPSDIIKSDFVLCQID